MSRLAMRFVAIVGGMLSTLGVESAMAGGWQQDFTIVAGLPIVRVWIGDAGPFRFALDTAAEHTMVHEALGARLHLSARAAVEIQTVAGARKWPLASVTDLRLSLDAPGEAVLVIVSDLEVVRRTVPSVDGVLGADVLSRYDYLIDYGARRLRISRDAALVATGGVTLPLTLHRGRPIVQWPVATHLGSELPLVLDSGANALVIDASLVAAFRCRRHTRRRTALETQVDSRDVDVCEIERLALGDAIVSGAWLVALPWPQSVERSDRGLLPASLFDRVHVSASRGTVTFWVRARPPV